MLKVPVLTPSLPIRRERESGRGTARVVRLPAESMLALLISSVGFTPGLRPAPSARSSKFHRESGAMRVDLERERHRRLWKLRKSPRERRQ